MARKCYTAEQIIGHLRQVEVMLSQGRKLEDDLREIVLVEVNVSGPRA